LAACLEPLYGYLLLAQRLHDPGLSFVGGWNFGPDDEDVKPVEWLVERITELWGKNASWEIDQSNNPHEAQYLKLDCSKAKLKLRWHPQWNLNVALDKTIKWYKAYYNREDMMDITINQINSYEKCIQEEE